MFIPRAGFLCAKHVLKKLCFFFTTQLNECRFILEFLNLNRVGEIIRLTFVKTLFFYHRKLLYRFSIEILRFKMLFIDKHYPLAALQVFLLSFQARITFWIHLTCYQTIACPNVVAWHQSNIQSLVGTIDQPIPIKREFFFAIPVDTIKSTIRVINNVLQF